MPRHPDVHQHDVGRVGVDRGGDLGAVGRPRRRRGCRRCRRASSTARRARARRRRRSGRGSRLTSATAATPTAGSRPSSVAPVLEPAAGEARALGQADEPGAGARDLGRAPTPTGSRLRISIVSPSPGAPSTVTSTAAPARACGRWSVPPGRSGTRCGRSPSGRRRRRTAASRSATRMPAARDSSISAGRSASVGCGRSGARRRGSSRSTPITVAQVLQRLRGRWRG